MNPEIQQAFATIRADEALVTATRRRLLSRAPARLRRRLVLRSATLVIVAICLLAASLASVHVPVAALSIDINPGIELDVNLYNRVVAARGFNPAGQAIVAALELEDRPVHAAVGAVIAMAARQGYLDTDGSSLIALTTSADLVPARNLLAKTAEKAARQALDEAGQPAGIVSEHTTLARVAQARELGISPGRMNLIEKLQELDPESDTDEYLETDISSLMRRINQLKQQEREPQKEPRAVGNENRRNEKGNQGKGGNKP